MQNGQCLDQSFFPSLLGVAVKGKSLQCTRSAARLCFWSSRGVPIRIPFPFFLHNEKPNLNEDFEAEAHMQPIITAISIITATKASLAASSGRR